MPEFLAKTPLGLCPVLHKIPAMLGPFRLNRRNDTMEDWYAFTREEDRERFCALYPGAEKVETPQG